MVHPFIRFRPPIGVVARTPLHRGFSLIELMTVIGVMTVILGVSLANTSKFGGTVSLRALTYDIALTIRQAQTYGISVKKFDSAFQSGFGMHFDLADPTHYIMFADENQNGMYDPPSEMVELETLNNHYTIADLCSALNVGGSMTHATAVNIVFRRPEPDAIITSIISTPIVQGQTRVVIASPRGDKMSVLVDGAGQIAVSKDLCE